MLSMPTSRSPHRPATHSLSVFMNFSPQLSVFGAKNITAPFAHTFWPLLVRLLGGDQKQWSHKRDFLYVQLLLDWRVGAGEHCSSICFFLPRTGMWVSSNITITSVITPASFCLEKHIVQSEIFRAYPPTWWLAFGSVSKIRDNIF